MNGFPPGGKKLEGKPMTNEKIMQMFRDTAYVRTGGSPEELACAKYLQQQCAELGLDARLESFEVDMATIHKAELWVDGEQIPCKGYLNSGCAELEAPFYYLANTDPWSLSQCKGKIVMVDGYLRYWSYLDIVKSGAVGIITYDGHVNYTDEDIDQRELRSALREGGVLPCVAINAKTAIRLVENNAATAKIVLQQDEYKGESWNVVLDLPGESEDTIVFTAHYDSTSLSQGAYDNMSGSVGILAMAEYFKNHPHRCSMTFVWCGSEERGLLGSKAYVAAHEQQLEKIVLNINLDMIGSIMGKFLVCCTTEPNTVGYVTYMGQELGFGLESQQDVYSSDSTPFADKGVPAISFARLAPPNTATIHNSYDTIALMKAEHMEKDIAFITAFADRMANAARCPVAREMPDNMKEKLDIYLLRKRAPKK